MRGEEREAIGPGRQNKERRFNKLAMLEGVEERMMAPGRRQCYVTGFGA